MKRREKSIELGKKNYQKAKPISSLVAKFPNMEYGPLIIE